MPAKVHGARGSLRVLMLKSTVPGMLTARFILDTLWQSPNLHIDHHGCCDLDVEGTSSANDKGNTSDASLIHMRHMNTGHQNPACSSTAYVLLVQE